MKNQPDSQRTGKKVEIIIFPAPSSQDETGATEYFECVAEDGAEYRVPEWTEEDFDQMSKKSAFEDDDTTAEDIFDV